MKKVLSAAAILVVAFSTFFEFTSWITQFSPLEQVISRRQSTRSYTSEDISSQQLLEVLSAAYGHFNDHRAVPQIGYDYSLMMFPVSETGSYRYIPEDNSLIVHDLTVNKETLRPHIQGWPSDASVVLVVVWNQTRMGKPYFACAEAGCLVQNVYLAAASLNLGTCCVGGIDSGGLRDDLGLPNTLIPVLVMPLGYPTTPYPPASPNYDFMVGNLPPVQYSSLSFEDALRNMSFVTEWPAENLSLQELSQLLWAAYGYSNVTRKDTYHRTTPSAYGIYPLVIFVSNSTGVYQYLPENHSVVEVKHGDRRVDIADACGGQVWAANAPAIFLIVYNSSYTSNGDPIPPHFVEIGAGAVIQQLLLEASAWNLGVNVISDGLQWSGTGVEELREILGLSSSLIPLYAVPIGSSSQKAIIKIWTEKKVYHIGETMTVYVRVKNPRSALPARAVIALELTDGSYHIMLDMTTTLPASFDSDEVLWNTFTLPSIPLGTYVWTAALLDPSTADVISLSTWGWQLL